MLVRTLVAATLALGLTASASASTIAIVPGTSDLWLAGMPNGSTASFSDSAPAQSPVEVLLLSLSPGDLLSFTATGATDHCDFGVCGPAGPEAISRRGRLRMPLGPRMESAISLRRLMR